MLFSFLRRPRSYDTNLPEGLTSYGYPLDNSPHRLGWLSHTEPSRPARELRTELNNKGYLWLKGVLDRQQVLDFRAAYFQALRKTGLLAEHAHPADGVYSFGPIDAQALRRERNRIVRWSSYASLCSSPELTELFEGLVSDPVHLYQRKLIRYALPHVIDATGAHYDRVYMRAGGDRAITCWIPLGDVPVGAGGVVYLENSMAWAKKLETKAMQERKHLSFDKRIDVVGRGNPGKGRITRNLAELAEEIDRRWLIAEYEAGDVVLHSAYMIHASTDNNDPDRRIRLSTDIRFQAEGEPVDARWQNDWFEGDRL